MYLFTFKSNDKKKNPLACKVIIIQLQPNWGRHLSLNFSQNARQVLVAHKNDILMIVILLSLMFSVKENVLTSFKSRISIERVMLQVLFTGLARVPVGRR